jgi:hypothetical protein
MIQLTYKIESRQGVFMADYTVKVWEKIVHTVDVRDAESEDDAYDKAIAIISGEHQGDYSTEADEFTGYTVEQE